MLEETEVSNEELETSENPDEQEPELDDEIQDILDEPESDDSQEDVASLKAKLAETEAKNKQLYARLKKDKPEVKAVRTEIKSQPVEDSDWKRKIEFITTTGRSLDADDIDEVIAYAKGKGIEYDEALTSPVIKSYLRVKQAREKIANATPHTSSKSTVVDGKTWAEMSEEERAKNYTKMLKKRA